MPESEVDEGGVEDRAIDAGERDDGVVRVPDDPQVLGRNEGPQ
jgi:hypothetical protein